jgi:serine/threonine protein kinase
VPAEALWPPSRSSAAVMHGVGVEFARGPPNEARDPMMTLPSEGELFDGKYRVGAVLGIGGMAAVIAARHLGLDELVAIKILLPECCDDPAVVERFVQEGKTATKIRSEHVVRMLDVGVVSGRAYLVMEHLAGDDLEALLRRDGPLPFVDAIDLLLQACEAIGEAHALGIVHRDLKPANLFLTHRVDGSACLKVLDFGISKMPRAVQGAIPTGASPTLPSLVMGSPQYMSPEQMVSAKTADPRADIWSLGAILYELVTGHVAFDGATTSEICAKVLVGGPAPVARFSSGVPDAVERVISRCLERDLSQRYASVVELAHALAPFGSEGARASAASIARVAGGSSAAEPRGAPVSSSGDGTMKPTAAEILATKPARRRHLAGYLGGSLLALAALGVAFGVVPIRWTAPAGATRASAPLPASAPPPQLATGARAAAPLAPVRAQLGRKTPDAGAP